MSGIVKLFNEYGSPIYTKTYGKYKSDSDLDAAKRNSSVDFMTNVYTEFLKNVFGNSLDLKLIDDKTDSSNFWFCYGKDEWDSYICISTSKEIWDYFTEINNSYIYIRKYSKNFNIDNTYEDIMYRNNIGFLVSFYASMEYIYNKETEQDEEYYSYTYTISKNYKNAYAINKGDNEGAYTPTYDNKSFAYIKDNYFIFSDNDYLNQIYIYDMINGKQYDICGFSLVSSVGDTSIYNISVEKDMSLVSDLIIHENGLFKGYFDSKYLKNVFSDSIDQNTYSNNSVLIDKKHYHQLWMNYFIIEDDLD